MVATFQATPELRSTFLGHARVAATMSNCPRSRESFKSGWPLQFARMQPLKAGACKVDEHYNRCWTNYLSTLHGDAFSAWPPRLNDMLAWIHYFTNLGAFANYEGTPFSSSPVAKACDTSCIQGLSELRPRPWTCQRLQPGIQHSAAPEGLQEREC